MRNQAILDVYKTNALQQDIDLSWTYDRKRLQKLARAVDPSVKLYTKDNLFSKILACLLVVVTFGGMRYHAFLNRYATTIGPLQFYPKHYTIKSVQRTLIHESRHTRHARWCSFGIHPWLGLPIYGILYLLMPLPLGFAYFRLWFEMDASKFAWIAGLQLGLHDEQYIRARAARFGRVVCSWKYGKSFPYRWGLPMFMDAGEQAILEAKKCMPL